MSPGSTDTPYETATELRTMHQRLQVLMVETAHKYPKSAPLVRHLAAAGEQLSKARSEGDERLAVEYPQDFETTVYYPGATADRT